MAIYTDSYLYAFSEDSFVTNPDDHQSAEMPSEIHVILFRAFRHLPTSDLKTNYLWNSAPNVLALISVISLLLTQEAHRCEFEQCPVIYTDVVASIVDRYSLSSFSSILRPSDYLFNSDVSE